MLPAENAILRKSVIGFYDYVNNSSIGEKHERIFPTLITYPGLSEGSVQQTDDRV